MAAARKIIDIRIVAERRPGKAEAAIQVMLDDGWDWDGRVNLSSTDGYVAVFTKSGTQKKVPPRTPKGTKFPKDDEPEMKLDEEI